MTLRTVEGPPGRPWGDAPAGRLDSLVVESEVLAGNPLGDPTRRPLYVYVPQGIEGGTRVPAIYVIQGYTGQLDMWLTRTPFEPTMFERADQTFSSEVPPAIVVFVDAWTSYGGSQFVNSEGTGRYLDYICDEIVPFVDERYPTKGQRDHRGITGKSSGGYGAMVVPMLRPDVFGAFASHAGDALFELSMPPEFAKTVRALRDHFDGSYDVFFRRLEEADHFDFERFGSPIMVYGMAACYTPDPERPGKAILPFDPATGRLRDDVWARWLEWDPVRMAPRHADALRSMRRIYLDAGRSDEYWLDLGAQAFSSVLDELGVEHTLELFDGKHGGIQYRYPRALKALAEALTPAPSGATVR